MGYGNTAPASTAIAPAGVHEALSELGAVIGRIEDSISMIRDQTDKLVGARPAEVMDPSPPAGANLMARITDCRDRLMRLADYSEREAHRLLAAVGG